MPKGKVASPIVPINEEFVALGDCLAELGRHCKRPITKSGFLEWADRYYERFYDAIRMRGLRWTEANRGLVLDHLRRQLAPEADRLAKTSAPFKIDARKAKKASEHTDCQPGLAPWEAFCWPSPSPAETSGTKTAAARRKAKTGSGKR